MHSLSFLATYLYGGPRQRSFGPRNAPHRAERGRSQLGYLHNVYGRATLPSTYPSKRLLTTFALLRALYSAERVATHLASSYFLDEETSPR